MQQPAQTVIYRRNEAKNPAWQFYSMPESIVGGAPTLDEARERYSEALKFSLDQEQLPQVNEYIEREIGSLGIWVRTPLRSHLGDRSFSQVASQVSQYDDGDREWFFRYPTAGGDPVLIPGTSEDRLSSIFAQMTQFDSLIVVMGHFVGEDLTIAWIVVDGVNAYRDARSEKPVGLDKLGLTPDSTLREALDVAMQMYGGHRSTALLAPVPV